MSLWYGVTGTLPPPKLALGASLRGLFLARVRGGVYVGRDQQSRQGIDMPADTVERLYVGTQLRAVTPSDTADQAQINGIYPRGFMVGASGNVVILAAEDSAAVTLTAVAAGIVHPIAFRRINATNTTATGIVAVF